MPMNGTERMLEAAPGPMQSAPKEEYVATLKIGSASYADKHNALAHNLPMRFLDRNDEMRRLDGVLSRSGAFAVLWGRRRVGKSRLLIEWSRRHGGLYAVADQSAPPVQRRYLAGAVAERFPGFADVEYPDWRSFLARLSAEAGRIGWPGPFVLDELPYLLAADPTLAGVLQSWLDRPERRLTLAVCGSSQHMMHGAILDAAAPLYGRAAEAFAVRPLRPGHLAEVFPFDGHGDLVSIYTLWGGMPRYWELAEPFGGDLETAVDALVLDPAGPLHGEPDRLLREETPPATALRPILDVIGNGAHRISEIAGRLGKPASGLSRPLASLMEMGLVRRETPFGSDPRSGKRSLYRIDDPFLRLWFRVVAPHRAALAAAPREARLRYWQRHRPGLESLAWEELCRMAVPLLHRSDTTLAGQRTGAGRRRAFGRRPAAAGRRGRVVDAAGRRLRGRYPRRRRAPGPRRHGEPGPWRCREPGLWRRRAPSPRHGRRSVPCAVRPGGRRCAGRGRCPRCRCARGHERTQVNPGRSPPPETARRFGVWMTAGAWIAILAVASLVFGDWLAERENPNRRVDTDVDGGGVREVVLEQNRAGHYLATGEIDGTRVVFLLDTGATDVSVPLGVARRLGLRGGTPRQARTASGIVTTYAVVLDRVAVGGIVQRRVRAHVNPHMPGDEVLLGMSFLRHIELVQRDRTLTLRQHPGRE